MRRLVRRANHARSPRAGRTERLLVNMNWLNAPSGQRRVDLLEKAAGPAKVEIGAPRNAKFRKQRQRQMTLDVVIHANVIRVVRAAVDRAMMALFEACDQRPGLPCKGMVCGVARGVDPPDLAR